MSFTRIYATMFATVIAVMFSGGRITEGAEESTLRVMTFNIRYATAPDGENSWLHRSDLLLDTITKFDPDLLGTQEVLAVQADFLTKKLTDYTQAGVGRDDGKRRGEFSPVMFKKSRFELVDSGTFWLSEAPDTAGSKSWDSSLPRIATWAILLDRQATKRNVAGGEICFLNTHWDHRGQKRRVESAKLIRHWLAEHAGKRPVIVTGDLNVDDENEAFRTLTARQAGEIQLVDIYRQVHPKAKEEEATFHGFSGKLAGKRIDFILASPRFSGVEATVDTTNRDGHYPSDHFPVTAVLKRATR